MTRYSQSVKLARYLEEVRDRRLAKRTAKRRALWFKRMKWDRTKLTKKDAAKARGMIAAGKTQAEVAAEFGVTRVCIRRYLTLRPEENKRKRKEGA